MMTKLRWSKFAWI